MPATQVIITPLSRLLNHIFRSILDFFFSMSVRLFLSTPLFSWLLRSGRWKEGSQGLAPGPPLSLSLFLRIKGLAWTFRPDNKRGQTWWHDSPLRPQKFPLPCCKHPLIATQSAERERERERYTNSGLSLWTKGLRSRKLSLLSHFQGVQGPMLLDLSADLFCCNFQPPDNECLTFLTSCWITHLFRKWHTAHNQHHYVLCYYFQICMFSKGELAKKWK